MAQGVGIQAHEDHIIEMEDEDDFSDDEDEF